MAEATATAPVILSVRDLDVKFNLRGRVLNAIRGISLSEQIRSHRKELG